jgi:hypothetical protein
MLALLSPMLAQAQTATEVLAQAHAFADQGDWFRAAPLYANAEEQFGKIGDRRNELYTRLGRLHRDAESGSYQATRNQVAQVLNEAVVQADPLLKIRALALLGSIDLNVNAAAAQEDWKHVLEGAIAVGDMKWQNRAKGQLAIVAGINGDLASAGLALYQCISKAGEIADIAASLHFTVWLASGMAVNGMADRAIPLLSKAVETSRQNGRDVPLQLSIVRIRALSLLPEPQ